MIDEVECPYCEEDVELVNDEGQYMNESDSVEAECNHCGKKFLVNAWCNWSYNGEKADCLNDGNHQWGRASGYPREIFDRLERCKTCGEERTKEIEK